MTDCRLCETNKLTDLDRVNGVCKECRERLGMLPGFPVPRRPPHPCPKCQGLRFVRVFPREHVTVGATSFWLGISTTGAVTAARVIEGLGHGLDEAALEAAKQSTFSPATKCGEPVETTFTIGMRFQR